MKLNLEDPRVDGARYLSGKNRSKQLTIDGETITLHPMVLKGFGETEQYMLSLRPDPHKLLDVLKGLPPALAERKFDAVWAQIESPPRVTVAEWEAFLHTLEGIAWCVYLCGRDDTDTINDVSDGMRLVLQFSEAGRAEELRDAMEFAQEADLLPNSAGRTQGRPQDEHKTEPRPGSIGPTCTTP